MTEPRRLGAIDVGTNTIRLLAVEEMEGEVRTLDDFGDVTRLGASLARTGEIEGEEAERSLEFLRILLERASAAQVTRLDIAGTEVFRAARNGPDVAAYFSRELGHAIQILTPAEEAEASYLGVVGWGGVEEPGLLRVLDVGGGSSEAVLGDGVALLEVKSLRLGALTVTERWLPDDPPGDAEVEAASKAIREFVDERLTPTRGDPVRTIAVGGSATAIGAWVHQIRPYSAVDLNGRSVTRKALESAIEELGRLSVRERMETGAMGEGRARVILGGALVLRALVVAFEIPEVEVSVFGLRHGLILKRILLG